MQWVTEKRFILKCEYLFLKSVVYAIKSFIHELMMFYPCGSSCFFCLWCKANVFIVYRPFITQYLCGGVLTSVMGWVWLDNLFGLNYLSCKVSIARIDFSFPLITHNVSDWFSLTNKQHHHRLHLSGCPCMQEWVESTHICNRDGKPAELHFFWLSGWM